MKKALLLFCYIFFSCSGQDCKDLPENFESYVQAKALVKSANFSIKQNLNVSASSWLKSVTFYSCDSKVGFVIMVTDKGKNYVHKNVPVSVWKDWKKANSKGSFYSKNVRGRYTLKL